MTRRGIVWLILGAMFFGATVFAVTIEGNLYLESTSFCGTSCHTMYPEQLTHAASPHANVPCGICHIAHGLKGFIRAKFVDGPQELWSLVTATYPTPIPTPLRHRMPAREMCERCHWPDKFYGQRLITLDRFDPDPPNSHRKVRLVLNTGGGSDAEGTGRGIHWHIQNEVTFGHTDRERQDVPWVKSTVDGKEVLFLAEGADPALVEQTEQRTMDCIDCHNRATHRLVSPVREIDRRMGLGHLNPKIPDLKMMALRLVDTEYESYEVAQTEIREGLKKHYAEKRPKVAEEYAKDLAKAAEVFIEIHRAGGFPEMKLTWRSHANNIGHREFPGCFRCHDGKHVSADGQVIRQSCNLCHQSVGEIREDEAGNLVPQPFRVIGDTHAEEDCTTCHIIHGQQEKTYDVRPERVACIECHEDEPGDRNPEGFVEGAPHTELPCFECHAIHYAERPPEQRCNRCHPGIETRGMHPLHIEEDLACDACHLPHRFRVEAASVEDTCLECHEDIDVGAYIKAFRNGTP